MSRTVADEWTYTNRASSGGGTIHTFTGPLWPHDGKPGDIRYARCSPASGWKLFIVEALNIGDLHDVPFEIVLERLPDEMGEQLRATQEALVEECGRIANTWINRRARYRRELNTVLDHNRRREQ